MKSKKRFRATVTVLISLLMMLSMFQMASAAEQANFPLYAMNGDLVANAYTKFTVNIEQDTATPFITAKVNITNGNTTTTGSLVISGVAFELSFDSNIALYRYNPVTDGNNHDYNAARLYTGNVTIDEAVFRNYCYTPISSFSTIGSYGLRGDATGGFIGSSITPASDEDVLIIAPGQTITVAEIYFMPRDRNTVVDASMFRFEYLNSSRVGNTALQLRRLTNWIGNGTFFLVGDPAAVLTSETWVRNKFDGLGVSQQFLMHVKKPAPAVSENFADRVVDGYSTATMEWATDPGGAFYQSAPVVPSEGITIYVRYAGTLYTSGTSGSYEAVYQNYKRNLPSETVSLTFPPDHFNAIPQLSKTGANMTTHPDNRTHVGDTIRYTVIAANAGNALSSWAEATMTDVMPAGVTFAGNVTRNNVTILPGPTGYTFDTTTNTLTVPLGDIAGQTNSRVTFDVTVNDDAYGTLIKNSVSVSGKDGPGGSDANENADEDGGGQTVVDRSAAPIVDPITEGDDIITGTGVPGAGIVVDLGDGGAPLTTTVGPTGNWSVNVPAGREPHDGDIVAVVQNELNKDPSEEVDVIVGGRPAPIKEKSKTSTNKTRSDGTRRVGDILEYRISVGNADGPKSLWMNVIVEDPLPSEVDYVVGSVKIDNVAVSSPTAVYNAATHTLTINLGNIAGGVTKIITFDAEINETAYGKTFVNTAIIDGESTDENGTIIPPVRDRSPQPTVDEVNEGDRTITGTGVAGATITVSFPNSTLRGTATVQSDGSWTVNVPNSINLYEGDEISAVQTVAASNLDPSAPVVVVVQGKKTVIPYVHKTSENTSSLDDKTHPGDTILFTVTIRNDGPKSVWTGVVMTDVIPDGVTLVVTSVRLNNIVPTFTSYIPATKTLSVTIGDIPYNVQHVVTFEAIVDADAFGKTILNSVSVIGKNNGNENIGDDADDDGGGFTISGQSDVPTVDPITRGDEEITGTGVPGATIEVELDDGTILTGTVDNNGDWSVDVPSNKLPDTDDTITVVQKEPNKDTSDPVVVIVVDKPYRGIHGFVWPLVSEDILGIAGFADMHAIVVELRPTYMTPADSALSVKATLVGDPLSARGEFTIAEVPFGSYVLYIHRPGYLTRAMYITITPAMPDMNELAPPGTTDNGVFNLWWGDCNDDSDIESKDHMMVIEQMDEFINVYDPRYNPACDLNADGEVESRDTMMVIEMMGRNIWMYAGSEDMDIFT